MKILLTGANGMVGKNILEHEKASQYDFLKPTSSELNLTNYLAVEEYIEKYKPDLVIHSAGIVGGIQANIKEPVRFLVENLEMGKNVLVASHKCGIKKLINMASSCMYPKDHQGLLEEEMILTGPLEPTNEGYALAKISVTKLACYINRERGENRFKTFIPCNLYGRWDKFSIHNSHMLPAVIRKIHLAKLNNEKSVEVWGTGEARREFMNAKDLADFTFFAINNWERVPEMINVGLGFDHSINDYYSTVAKVLGYSGEFYHDISKPEGMKQKLVSVKKATALGWHAPTTLEEGIKAAYQFFLEKENL